MNSLVNQSSVGLGLINAVKNFNVCSTSMRVNSSRSPRRGRERKAYKWLKDIQPETMRRPESVCLGVCQMEAPAPVVSCSIEKVRLERAKKCHEDQIASFLWDFCWGREPATASLFIPSNSKYLAYLTEKYSTSGDRILCFEHTTECRKGKLLGLVCGEQMDPDVVTFLEQWGTKVHQSGYVPEADHLFLMAHCINNADIFRKYSTTCVYNISALVTHPGVAKQGIGSLLLKCALLSSMEKMYPVTQVIATNHYLARICERLRMTNEWSSVYADLTDNTGRRVFFPRYPHHKISVYSRQYKKGTGTTPDKCDEPELFAAYQQLVKSPKKS